MATLKFQFCKILFFHNQNLKDRLEVVTEEKELLECRAEKLYEQIREMNSEVEQIEGEILR
jgi:chaperonin cofactor prefoldin